MSVADLASLDKEYADLQAKFKNNYEIVEFYPTLKSLKPNDVGCFPADKLGFQRIDDKLHTPNSCLMAAALLANKSSYNPNKTMGLYATIHRVISPVVNPVLGNGSGPVGGNNSTTGSMVSNGNTPVGGNNSTTESMVSNGNIPVGGNNSTTNQMPRPSLNHVSTKMSSLPDALGDKMPPQTEKYSVIWTGILVPDITGKWTITLNTNSTTYMWKGDVAVEAYNETNAVRKITPTKDVSIPIVLDLQKGKPIPITLKFEHSNLLKSPSFSLNIAPPSGSAYATPEKMYECLFHYTNPDGTLFKTPQMYYGFVENSPEDTEKNLFQCHYATSLNDAVNYGASSATEDGFFRSTEEQMVWSLLDPKKEADVEIIKPANVIRIDANGVHIFNAQNVLVRTLYALKRTPRVRYIRMEANEDKKKPVMLNLNEIEVFDENGGKIPANEMSAKLSPQYGDSRFFGPKYLIDGNTTSKDKKGKHNLPHTTESINAYMEIDLLKPRPITKVNVYNRNDCCNGRVLNAQLVLLDGQKKRVCHFPISQIKNMYEFNISKDGCETTSMPASNTMINTGIKYRLALLGDKRSVRFVLVRDEPNGKSVVETVLADQKVSGAVPSDKWRSENHKFSAEEVSFTQPLVSADAKYKLMVDSFGNISIYASYMGCRRSSGAGSSVRYRNPATSGEHQYVYGLEKDEKFNKMYYANKKDNTLTPLPRNNPMLENTYTYTPLSGFIPHDRSKATEVPISNECMMKCNDNSGCSWYSTYRENDKNMCILGEGEQEDILPQYALGPMESGITLGAIHVRNKRIPLNEKYMLGDNIPFNKVMESSKYAPYSAYTVNHTPIVGKTPIGFLSEGEVKDFFKRQGELVGKQGTTSVAANATKSVAANANATTVVEGMDIISSSGERGAIYDIENTLLIPAKKASHTYNSQLQNMYMKNGAIGEKIGEYEKVREVMNSNKKYKFHPDDITSFREKPTLADGIVEDNKEFLYQQNLVYFSTGVAVLTLGIAAVMIASR